MTRMTTSMVQRAVLLHGRGMSSARIAAVLGCSARTVRLHLAAQGVDTSAGRSAPVQPPYTAAQDALTLYRHGASIRAVARRLLVGYTAARTLLQHHGVLRTRTSAAVEVPRG